MRKYTIKEVKKKFKESGCKLLEVEYISNRIKMRYKCKCGREDEVSLSHLNKKQRCKECIKEKISFTKRLSYKYVKKYFKDHNCRLLETEYINNYTLMRYRCDCGNTKCKIRFDSFKRGQRCKKCGIKKVADKKRLTYKEVKKYFEDNDCELLETEYINSHTPMKFRCDCGNDECKIRFTHFKNGHRCRKCWIERISGENNCNYNPNLTDEERNNKRDSKENIKWRKDIYKRDNFICQFCFKKGGRLIAHHLESYDNNEELRLVVSNGITLCEELHIKFHKLYGYGNNTTEQFNEFLKIGTK